MTNHEETAIHWFDGQSFHHQRQSESAFPWLDVDRATRGWQELAEDVLGARVLDEHARDANNAQHPPFYDECEGYALLVFPDISVAASGLNFETGSISALFSKTGLVTIRSQDSPTTERVRKALSPTHAHPPRRPFGMLLRLLTVAADKFLEVLPSAQTDMENFRNRVLDPQDRVKDWTKMYERRAVYRQMRNLARQFEGALLRWDEDADLEMDDRTKSRFNNLMEHLRRAINELREHEAEVDSLVELHFAATAHQTNETVRILTVLSSIFLPLTFLAGIFGMNFDNMPELHMRYGYPVALGSMAAIALFLCLIFRRKGWF